MSLGCLCQRHGFFVQKDVVVRLPVVVACDSFSIYCIPVSQRWIFWRVPVCYKRACRDDFNGNFSYYSQFVLLLRLLMKQQ